MRLPAKIAFPLLRRSQSGSSGLGWQTDGTAYDYVIGGIPLISAATTENPFRIRTVPLEREVLTATDGPVERSLNQWWLEGQSSWHGGAGLAYRDSPGTERGGAEGIRYATSHGVDVWEPGRLSLLPQARPALATAGAGLHVSTGWVFAGPAFIAVTATTITRVVADGYTVAGDAKWITHNLINVPTIYGTVRRSIIVGDTVWILAQNGIFKTTMGGMILSPPSAPHFTWPAGSDPAKSHIAYVRERLVVLGYTSGKATLTELDQNAAAGAMPAPTFTMPTPGMTWTDICDGPNGFYTGIRMSDMGFMHRWGIDSQATVPEIMAPVMVAEFPRGEYPVSLAQYVGTTIGVATNQGMRIAEIRTDGSVEYGPDLIGDGYGTVTAGVCGRGSYIYAGYSHSNGTPGALRVDLSQPLSSQQYAYQPAQRYAWAPDVSAWEEPTPGAETELMTGATSQVLTFGDRLLLVVPGSGVYVTNPNIYATGGELESSVLRYGTLELKQFRFARLGCDQSSGYVRLRLGAGAALATDVVVMQPSRAVDSGDIALHRPANSTAVVTLTLERPVADRAHSPQVRFWQLKASPAQARQHLISVPVRLADHETDRSGQDIRNQGSALARLLQLEDLVRSAAAVDWTVWHSYPEQRLSRMVTIEEIQYDQRDAPHTEAAWGGVLTVVLRTLE